MQEWINGILHISKHIRQVVEPLMKNVEIEDLAIQYIRQKWGSLYRKPALVIGTGVVGKAIIRRLSPLCSRIYWCCHKNKPSGKLAEAIRLCGIEELETILPDVDLIIGAAAAATPVITSESAPFFSSSGPITVLDLASPRNVSKDLEKLVPTINITDLDDLKHWFRREAVDRTDILKLSDEMVKEHHCLFEKLTECFQGKPDLFRNT